MTQTTQSLSLLNRSASHLPVMAQLAVRFAGLVTRWDMVRRSRIDLQYLDDHLLKDIGKTHDEVRAEVARPFWRL